MTRQEIFDRGVAGTIVQGFVHFDTYVSPEREKRTAKPCRCSLGHSSTSPVGKWNAEDYVIAKVDSFHFNRRFARANDASASLEDYRERMSTLALACGLDDSCCWWEVTDA